MGCTARSFQKRTYTRNGPCVERIHIRIPLPPTQPLKAREDLYLRCDSPSHESTRMTPVAACSDSVRSDFRQNKALRCDSKGRDGGFQDHEGCGMSRTSRAQESGHAGYLLGPHASETSGSTATVTDLGLRAPKSYPLWLFGLNPSRWSRRS